MTDLFWESAFQSMAERAFKKGIFVQRILDRVYLKETSALRD